MEGMVVTTMRGNDPDDNPVSRTNGTGQTRSQTPRATSHR